MTGALKDFRQSGYRIRVHLLAVQDMINGNVKYVIIDAAPAESITKAINAMQ